MRTVKIISVTKKVKTGGRTRRVWSPEKKHMVEEAHTRPAPGNVRVQAIVNGETKHIDVPASSVKA